MIVLVLYAAGAASAGLSVSGRPDRWPAPPGRPTALVALAVVLAGLVLSLGSV